MTHASAPRLRPMMLAALATVLSFALSWALMPAVAMAQQTRQPTAQEQASFQAWHQHQPNAGAVAPVVQVTRDSDTHPWRLQARQDGPPRRALRTLCRMERRLYTFDSQWQAGAAQQFAWHAPTGCSAIANPIALGQRMPDTDILALIEHQGALLARARLLFAGNTACAPQRAHNYRLTGIDVSIFIHGSEEMATLTYQSDRGPSARVWARRTGLAYDPWNVSCP